MEETPTVDDKISKKLKQINDRKNGNNKKRRKQSTTYRSHRFNERRPVRLKGQNSVGEVLYVNDNEVTVAFGLLKSTVKADRLEKGQQNQIKKENSKATFISSQTTDDMREKQLNFKQEIDVRGMRADEALQAVTYFIDDAIQVGCARVRILHGTGTGVLRQVIRQYLKTVPGVSHFQDEHVQLGGAGITVVELN